MGPPQSSLPIDLKGWCRAESTSYSGSNEYRYEERTEDDDSGTSVEKMLRDTAQAIYHAYACQVRYDREARLRLPAAHFVFSDIEGTDGDRFGQWLATQKFGDVTRVSAKNPNSGNMIATYLWVPDEKALSKTKEWRTGKAAAARELRAMRKNGW